jgi:hypothetical protein
MAPVRYKCRIERPFPDLDEEFEFCEWEADAGVKAVKLDCEKSKNRYVLTRNMDDSRAQYPWRVSRFDLDSGEPYGHAYGKNPAHALNEWVAKWEKCKVVAVRTESGQGDFGRAGFEKLTTTPLNTVATAEAKRVVAAFLRGETGRGACKGKKDVRSCAIVSDGRTLQVSGATLATREGNRLTVCVPSTTTMQQKGKRRHETEDAKDVRVAASLLLKRVAGVGIRTSPEGQRLLTTGARASMLVPASCMVVQVPKRQVTRLLSTQSATEAAKIRFKTQYPSRTQVARMQKILREEQRMTALTKARGMRVRAPGEPPLPDEEFAPESLPPEPPPQEEPLYPEPEEPAYEEPEFDAEAEADAEESWRNAPEGPALPTDVRFPTDPEGYADFVTNYLPKLRKGARRDAALAWQAYVLDPKNAPHPGARPGLSDRQKAAVREVELEIARKGVVDPIYGFVDPDMARIQAAWNRRKDKPGKSQDRAEKIRNREWAEEMRMHNTSDLDTYYKFRRSRK